ncbi:RCC1 and BTB domain-containing protein 2 [Hondaea fermentalgiana]|uniref:RCC1 and BTB domain-containing protein 2 n=1 Tax=Hondaea fermentalgiana TaxID=2315210 RepID=A0A2R5GWT9_9STRA|nr:RCC1 and BTB domain-containing protein 2 [Hondaea fermentalgiana]|eukprot:GBG34238.1 RCC1 and BTB domain-containing protein 2 [Hondaea fermentalgiana]
MATRDDSKETSDVENGAIKGGEEVEEAEVSVKVAVDQEDEISAAMQAIAIESIQGAEAGTLMGWGRNRDRELGFKSHGALVEERDPRIIDPFEAQGVVQVSAGEKFSMILDEFGNLHSCGVNNQGQLGRKATADYAPGLVGGPLVSRRVVSVASGHTASAAITEDGELYEWGLVHFCPPADDAEAASIEVHGLQPNRYYSDRVKRLVRESTIRYLSSRSGIRPDEDGGAATSGATGASAARADTDEFLDEESRAFHAKNFEDMTEEEREIEAKHRAREKELAPAQQMAQRNGVVNLRSRRKVVQSPLRAASLGLRKAAKVSLGAAHVVVLTTQGEILTKGYNDRGQLGTGHRFSRAEFGPVVGVLASIAVSDVVCGSSHTLALTDAGEIWAFGVNTFGQLGIGATTVERLVPNRIDKLANAGIKVTQIAAGEYHSLCLTDTNEVFSWGHAEYGQHGAGGKEGRDLQYAHLLRHFYEPRPVRPFCSAATVTRDANQDSEAADAQAGSAENATAPDTTVQVPVRFIASAARYTLAVDKDGRVWSWGWNGSGVLGHGPGARYTEPQVIEALAGRRVTHVTAGPNHVLVAVEQLGSQFALSYAPLLSGGADAGGEVSGAPITVGMQLRPDRENNFDIRIRSKLSATQERESEAERERKYSVPCHKFVLFARCPSLRDHLHAAASLEGKSLDEVRLPFVLAPLVLKALVEYLYTDHLRSCPPHRLIDLQQVAERLGLVHLEGLCKLARHQRTLRMSLGSGSFVADQSASEAPALPPSTFARDMRRAVEDTSDHNIFLGATDPDEDVGDGDVADVGTAPLSIASSANMDILCRYPFFEKLLTGSFKESVDAQDKDARIMLHNLTPRGLSTLLYWVYSGDRAICQPETVMSVLASARCFGVDDLARVCEALIIDHIDAASVDYIEEFAQDTNSQRLLHYCRRFRDL